MWVTAASITDSKKKGKKGKKKGTKEKGTRLYQLGLKNLILLVFNNMILFRL